MFRLLAPFLWVAGAFVMMSAILVPVLNHFIFFKQSREHAEQLIEQIVRQEESYFQIHKAYLPFAKGEIPGPLEKILGEKRPATQEFTYDLYLSQDNLILRATTATQKLTSGTWPIMIFVYKKQLSTNKITREWLSIP
ncbi:MAG: hypothetical protein H7832_09520 [Magnetococcus sp. DMHC-6]